MLLGNKRTLILSGKEIMSKTVLILKMDSRFHGNDGDGYSHFHGMTDTNKTKSVV
jgi:hypothetical protein